MNIKRAHRSIPSLDTRPALHGNGELAANVLRSDNAARLAFLRDGSTALGTAHESASVVEGGPVTTATVTDLATATAASTQCRSQVVVFVDCVVMASMSVGGYSEAEREMPATISATSRVL